MIHVVLIQNRTYITGTSMFSTTDGYKKILSFPDRKLIYYSLWKVEIRIREEAGIRLGVEKSQKNNMIAEELGEFFLWITDEWGRRKLYHKYVHYEDIKTYSVFLMCKSTKNIDLNKARSCFTYYLQVAIYTYKKFTTNTKQAKIKNSMKFLQDVSIGNYRYD